MRSNLLLITDRTCSAKMVERTDTLQSLTKGGSRVPVRVLPNIGMAYTTDGTAEIQIGQDNHLFRLPVNQD